jgi:ferrochelatase
LTPAAPASDELGLPPLTAVLLVNLGTPAEPTPKGVRRYLLEFLSDSRVVDLPRWFWLPLLYGAIVPIRARRSAHAYRQVWTAEGSPLRAFSERLAQAVAGELGGAAGPQERVLSERSRLAVRLAMRYGEPSVASVMRELRAKGLVRLLVLPLYPQYSGTTTASVFDAAAAELRRWPRLPELRFVTDYHSDPAYLDALAATVRAQRANGRGGSHLLLSLHGIPQRYVRAGDPYAQQCQATARGLIQRLGLAPDAWSLSYQSRVGREPWLEPDTEATLIALARSGTTRVDVICPGFAVDCLETLEEVALRYAAKFREAGGTELNYIPALNATPAHAALLAGVVRRACGNWPPFAPGSTHESPPTAGAA